MKKLIIVAFFMAISVTVFAQPKQKIAVYMTGNDTINEIVSYRLMSDFRKSGKYTPIERNENFLKAVTKEHAYERSGEVDDAKIAALGKQFGLNYVCVASVLDVWGGKYITAHIIDVNRAIVIGACNTFEYLRSSSDLIKILDKLSDNLHTVLSHDTIPYVDSRYVAVCVLPTDDKIVDNLLGDQLVAYFSDFPGYLAVERSHTFLKKLNNAKEYEFSGNVAENMRFAKLGKNAGVQFVCVVKRVLYGGKSWISSRLINVETSEVEAINNIENYSINSSTWNVSYLASRIAVNLSYEYDVSHPFVKYDVPDDEEEIFYVVERAPQFIGGLDALYEFLGVNVKYPQLAKENNIEGKVYATFVVEKDGRVTNAKIIKDIGGRCGDEVLRLINSMPYWLPGYQRTSRVRVQYNLPVDFNLN